MNAQPNVQLPETNSSPLYTVTNPEGRSGDPGQSTFRTVGETSQSIASVSIHPATGKQIHFVARIQELIETNMDDETYGIDQLCRDAGASRSQLHNKLKKWTGLSTSHYIRSIRLQRAKYLLVQTDLNITQVAYEVGFADPSYFSRVFDESFGICPKNFRKRWQKSYSA